MAQSESPTPDTDEAVWDVAPPSVKPIYGIDERPPKLWQSLLFAWQHTLVDISPFVLPLAVAGALGLAQAQTASFINSCLIAMGIATLIQTTFGNRLPIVQGPSATLTGTLAPVASQLGGPAMWGGVVIGALVEMVIGAARLLALLRHLLPLAVSGVVVLTIGLSLGQLAARLSLGGGDPVNFALAGLVIALIVLFQTLGRRVAGGMLARSAVFISIWAVGLGVAGVMGKVDWALVAEKPWFAPPSLFPFGGPGFGWQLSIAAVLVVLAGYFGSIVESLGDYANTCAVSGETYRVRHMNRGIFAEGLGCAIASTLGALPCTSYSQNVGILATTRIASRYVVQLAAGILILYGLCPKFGALLVAMPRAVLGGVFVVVCGMIAISGIRMLGAAQLEGPDALVVGTTLITAVGVPIYVRGALGQEWLDGLPQVLALLLTNSVVLAVVLGISLNLVVRWLVPAEEGHADGKEIRE